MPPTVSTVKAFNLLEVSDLVGEKTIVKVKILKSIIDNRDDETFIVQDVPIASDNPSARVLVSSLVSMMGHRPVDFGDLSRARQLENSPLSIFPGYRVPILVSAAIWSLLHLVSWLRTLLCHHGNITWDLDQVHQQ